MEILEFFFSPMFIVALGAALAVILPGIGSAKAVGRAGEAVAGLMSNDPDKFGQALALNILPATQGIYGFVVAFMVMINSGVLGGKVIVTHEAAFYLLGACLPIAIAGYASAIAQGKTAVAGINMVAKHPEASGKAITSTALVETYAILALLVSVLMILSLENTELNKAASDLANAAITAA